MGIASLVVSIIAIILSIIPVVGLPIALIALILAIIAMCRKKNKEVHRGFKIAGLILSILAVVCSVFITGVTVVTTMILVDMGGEIIDQVQDEIIDQAQTELSNISGILQSQIINSYDGRTVSGSELLASTRMYQNSDSVAMLITTTNDVYHVGAGVITLPRDTTEADYKVGGITGGSIAEGATDTYSDLVEVISAAKYYKTAVVYDNAGNMIGIAAIEM